MQNTENVMGSKKVLPLLMTMGIPPMLSMLIQSLYNIVDSIFVAKLSQDALTAVSLAYPLQNLVLAVAVGLGVGANACIAISLGEKNSEVTNSTCIHGFIFSAIHTLIFIVFGLVFTKPFIRMFTDNPEIIKMSCEYAYIVICLSFGTIFHIYIEKLFQATGNMILPMVMLIVGSLTNIILDPILIFGLMGFPKMGVAGAAIATVCGQILACATSFLLFFRKSNPIRLTLKGFKLDKHIIGKIYSIAVPSAIMISLPSILVGILNAILAAFSDVAVAVFGLYYKLQTFIYMPANGLVQGMRPIVSYNYGAKNKQRLNDTLRYSMIITVAIMAVGTIVALAFPHQLMQMFDANDKMFAIGVPALRIISLGFIVSSLGMVLPGAFEALGMGIPSLLISLIRQLIIIPPLAFVLAHFIGLNGVWVAFPIAELLAAILGILLYRKTIKGLFD